MMLDSVAGGVHGQWSVVGNGQWSRVSVYVESQLSKEGARALVRADDSSPNHTMAMATTSIVPSSNGVSNSL